ncbi:hypothetical protein [Thalassotalea sp. ND16A]|uniref:hypothetical protein n=1 Tax=Thalassotalea sp. ND16A TaxID=1535422 RepID=UPI00051A274F|nr:hypothetical protein [Thalassotalea sp. ND16A]KGJ99037.1 hypothetical protein ND16A_0425 [Thalassotalea sp. ND16A]
MLKQNYLILGVITSFVILFFIFTPALSQSIEYHSFADQGNFYAIPNTLNVLSNLPFIAVGLYALSKISNNSTRLFDHHLALNYQLFFAGLIATGIGSSFYHLNPTNFTLIFDRLGIAFSFMAIFSALLGEFVSVKLGKKCLLPFIFIGIASVIYWGISEHFQQGDLRGYLLVQYLPMIILPIIVLTKTWPYTDKNQCFTLITIYFIAKLCELFDNELYAVIQIVSGHTLKHLFAAFAGYWVYWILIHRKPR